MNAKISRIKQSYKKKFQNDILNIDTLKFHKVIRWFILYNGKY